jgi:hypothetical protein
VRLRIRYHRYRDLATDWDQQLSRGGVLVRVEPPPGLEQFQAIEVEIVAPRGAIVLNAQVVQLFASVGIAVTFPPNAMLEAAAANAKGASDAAGGEPEHSLVDGASTERVRPVQVGDSSGPPKIAGNPVAEQLHRALYGGRDDRSAVMREGNAAMQSQVLRNPGLQLDEVVAIARSRTVSAELLKIIAEKREWAQRPEIAVALVRNPKTPVPLAVRLLDHVSREDLRQIAKDGNTRAPVMNAARKKVLG